MNTALHCQVAKCLGFPVHIDGVLQGELHLGAWVELSANHWQLVDDWAVGMAERVIDHVRIETTKKWDGANWQWKAKLDSHTAIDNDRRSAALMAFCNYRENLQK